MPISEYDKDALKKTIIGGGLGAATLGGIGAIKNYNVNTGILKDIPKDFLVNKVNPIAGNVNLKSASELLKGEDYINLPQGTKDEITENLKSAMTKTDNIRNWGNIATAATIGALGVGGVAAFNAFRKANIAKKARKLGILNDAGLIDLDPNATYSRKDIKQLYAASMYNPVNRNYLKNVGFSEGDMGEWRDRFKMGLEDKAGRVWDHIKDNKWKYIGGLAGAAALSTGLAFGIPALKGALAGGAKIASEVAPEVTETVEINGSAFPAGEYADTMASKAAYDSDIARSAIKSMAKSNAEGLGAYYAGQAIRNKVNDTVGVIPKAWKLGKRFLFGVKGDNSESSMNTLEKLSSHDFASDTTKSMIGTGTGALAGLLLGGPIGAAIGAIAGQKIGPSIRVDSVSDVIKRMTEKSKKRKLAKMKAQLGVDTRLATTEAQGLVAANMLGGI